MVVLDLVNRRCLVSGIVVKDSLSPSESGRLCVTQSDMCSNVKLLSLLILGSLLTVISVAPLLSSVLVTPQSPL